MFAGVKREVVTQHAKYWGFFLLKLVGAYLGAGLALSFLNLFWAPHTRLFHIAWGVFSYDLLYTTLVGVWFQFAFGLVYLAFRDQRYRCRTCLRKLCMPIETGSWGHMLRLGRPQFEYICPYGHGKLNVEEVQFTGTTQPSWTEHGDIWDELFAAASKDAADRDQ
jgi:hypothetical protein